MAMLEAVMGVWIIASIISEVPNVPLDPNAGQNLGRLATFSTREATFNEKKCPNPKYAFHPKDKDADDHVKISCPSNAAMTFPNLYGIDDQHIRAKVGGINYELYRFEKQQNKN
jgi:hypothetical protein